MLIEEGGCIFFKYKKKSPTAISIYKKSKVENKQEKNYFV